MHHITDPVNSIRLSGWMRNIQDIVGNRLVVGVQDQAGKIVNLELAKFQAFGM
ncbi:MAG: hypothetical protein IPM36_17410 [Lewinellaceae bacterium]|nr:hypothetical protein [Lewinellaceae bacterium]